MKEICRKFVAFCDIVAEGCGWLSAIVVMFMCVVTLIDVVGRYFFNAPLRGGQEMVEMSMNIFAYSGLLYAMYKQNYIKIPVVLDAIKPKTRAIVELVIQLLSFGICVLLSYAMWISVSKWMTKWTVTTTVLGIPYTPFYIFTAISLTFISLQTLIHFFKQLNAIRNLKTDEKTVGEGGKE